VDWDLDWGRPCDGSSAVEETQASLGCREGIRMEYIAASSQVEYLLQACTHSDRFEIWRSDDMGLMGVFVSTVIFLHGCWVPCRMRRSRVYAGPRRQEWNCRMKVKVDVSASKIVHATVSNHLSQDRRIVEKAKDDCPWAFCGSCFGFGSTSSSATK
jgi:hypothetical protein